MNKLNISSLSNQIATFKNHSSSFLFITRRNYTLPQNLAHHHKTYHKFIDQNWSILRRDYSSNSSSMPVIGRNLKPLGLSISNQDFYHLFRNSLNGSVDILDFLSYQEFQNVCTQYKKIMNGIDFEDVLIIAEHFLRNFSSQFLFVHNYEYIVIPDYYLLLENPKPNANAIYFIHALIRYCSNKNINILTVSNNRFVSIQI